jgi:hypothetical protein
VTGIAALIRCPLGRESPPGYRIELPRDSEPRRVNVNADWYYTVSIMEFLDGKVARETQYFGDPFEPGPSRAQWVERMP